KKTHLSRDTIRYYESIGLLSPLKRKENGYREYGETHIREIQFIIKSKEIGFTLEEIKKGLVNLRINGSLCKEFKIELNNKKEQFKKRIEKDKLAIKKIEKILK